MDRTSASNIEQDLLRNRNTNKPLGAFDGRVAVLHPERPGWFILSPNCDYIALPPGTRCNVYVRFDGRFGPDDHTQWPQPFSRRFPHLCCIPKKKQGNPHSVIWENPQIHDFERIQNDIIGLGKWSGSLLEALRKSNNWLLEELARRRANNKTLDSHPEVVALSTNLERALSRLRAVPVGYRGAVICLRLAQRLWLELYALMEYVDKYLPSMEGRAPPETQIADVVGCFVHTANSAQRLFSAGIPYWVVREVRTFDKENILSIGTIVKPQDMLVVEDHPTYAPRIYQGDSNDNRYMTICNYSLKFMGYADPFCGVLPRGISPHNFSQMISQAGRSREGSTRNHTTSFQPYKKPSGGNTGGRDKFDLVNSLYMPPCLDSWRAALRAVDQRRQCLYSLEKLSSNDGKYAFPEPGIFCSGDNARRRNKFLTVWEILQPVVVNRMSSDLGSVSLLSNEQWRILLAGREPNDKTKRGSVRASITDLLSQDALDLGVGLSKIHEVEVGEYSIRDAQGVLWELAEMSFRFDLVMLDKKALAARGLENTAYNMQLLSPLSRQRLIMACFPFGPADPRHLAFVDRQHARRGLASPTIRDRIPYLNALRAVMKEWDGYEVHPIGRLEVLTEDAPVVEGMVYEEAVAHFYTQSFFRFFGRAAIVPMYLED
ncbi:hypothetical protein F5887DRAFT_1081524 [Amanita rubescens]|nr:hypothetical protein F5887DRAFT_1081524 [Amanita rubescens]